MKNLSKQQFIKSFEMYHTFVYRYVFLKVNNKHIAEDLTQEVFLKLWKTRKNFDKSKSQLKTWIARIAHNLVVDYFRSNKEKLNLNLDEVKETLVSSDNENIDNKIELVKYLKTLDELSQQVIILKYIEGFEIDEISKIINKKYDATRMLIFRAIKKLKETINEGI